MILNLGMDLWFGATNIENRWESEHRRKHLDQNSNLGALGFRLL